MAGRPRRRSFPHREKRTPRQHVHGHLPRQRRYAELSRRLPPGIPARLCRWRWRRRARHRRGTLRPAARRPRRRTPHRARPARGLGPRLAPPPRCEHRFRTPRRHRYLRHRAAFPEAAGAAPRTPRPARSAQCDHRWPCRRHPADPGHRIRSSLRDSKCRRAELPCGHPLEERRATGATARSSRAGGCAAGGAHDANDGNHHRRGHRRLLQRPRHRHFQERIPLAPFPLRLARHPETRHRRLGRAHQRHCRNRRHRPPRRRPRGPRPHHAPQWHPSGDAG